MRRFLARKNELKNYFGMGTPLGEYVNGRFYYGIKTGLNEAFVVDRATRDRLIAEHESSAEVLKPFLRGRDVKRWCIDSPDLWLLFIPWHFPLHNDSSITGASSKAEKELEKLYPAIYNHLLQFKSQLSARNKTETGIRYEWYALQRCAASYHQYFEKQKIVWGNLATKPGFTFSDEGTYINAPANLIISDNKYLLGVLNSQLNQYLVSQSAATRQGGFLEYKPMYVSQLSIPTASKADQQVISALVQKCLDAKGQGVEEWEAEIDYRIVHMHGLTPEEMNIIKG
jgi:adenine-specific DNA-methyltransferase